MGISSPPIPVPVCPPRCPAPAAQDAPRAPRSVLSPTRLAAGRERGERGALSSWENKKTITVIAAGKTLRRLPRSRAAPGARRAGRPGVSGKHGAAGSGGGAEGSGRGQARRSAGPKAFLPGRMEDVSQQGRPPQRGHRAMKEAMCADRHCRRLLLPRARPSLDPAVPVASAAAVAEPWLIPQQAGCVPNLNRCSAPAAGDGTPHPSAAPGRVSSASPGPRLRRVPRSETNPKAKAVGDARQGGRRRGVAQAIPAVLVQGGAVAGFPTPEQRTLRELECGAGDDGHAAPRHRG